MQLAIEAYGQHASCLSYLFDKKSVTSHMSESMLVDTQIDYFMHKSDHVKAFTRFHGFNPMNSATLFLTYMINSVEELIANDKEGFEQAYQFTISLSPLSSPYPDNVFLEMFQPLGYQVSIRRVREVIYMKLEHRIDIGTLFQHLSRLIPFLDNSMIEHIPYGDEIEIRSPQGELRLSTFADIIKGRGFKEVVDMGAGEGRLIELLIHNKQLTSIYACEPELPRIMQLQRNLDSWTNRGDVLVQPVIIQSSLFDIDERLTNKECMVLCEVIEHIDLDLIDQVASTLLGQYSPKNLLLSTPNYEYNVAYGLDLLRQAARESEMTHAELKGYINHMVTRLDDLRHPDHRFEMTRADFRRFIQKHADTYSYSVEFIGIGEHHPDFGPSTQMAILTKARI